MTASDLFHALAGLPKEATCQTIWYHPLGNAWYGPAGLVPDDHAEALQRDSMTDYLCRIGTIRIKTWPDGCAVSIPHTFSEAHAPSRTLALIAAVRHVAGEGKV